jgi:hypothetical protein
LEPTYYNFARQPQPAMHDLPPLLDWAASKLDVRVLPFALSEHKDIRAYFADLSRFRLRLSDRTPCIALPADAMTTLGAARTKRLLDDVLIAQKWQNRNVLVLVDGDGADLRLLCERDMPPPITLDGDAQARIMSDGSQALIEEISRQTHISALAPYETSRPVTGEQFFGRESELRTLLSNEHTSYLIVGNRRMGKTSLMREASRRIRQHAKHPDSVLYFDTTMFVNKLDLFTDIVRALAPREVERAYGDKTFSMPSFFQRMHRARREKIVLCLDEIDHLMQWDQRDNWSALNMLRAVCTGAGSDDPPMRVLMAGFRLAQDMAKNRDAPVFNFASLLRVTPFDMHVTQQIVVEPLLNLGVGIVDRGVIVQRIFRETGGQPNLIQHYCQFIVRQLEAHDTRTLTPAILDAALNDDGIRRRTADELIANASNVEQLLVFCFIEHGWTREQDAFTLEDADRWVKSHGVQLLRVDFEKALDALTTSGIFQRDGQRYSFMFTALPRTLTATQQPAYQIAKIIEEGL